MNKKFLIVAAVVSMMSSAVFASTERYFEGCLDSYVTVNTETGEFLSVESVASLDKKGVELDTYFEAAVDGHVIYNKATGDFLWVSKSKPTTEDFNKVAMSLDQK